MQSITPSHTVGTPPVESDTFAVKQLQECLGLKVGAGKTSLQPFITAACGRPQALA